MSEQADDTIIDGQTGEILSNLPVEVAPMVAAEINQQVATAKRYPRRPDSAITTEIQSRACLDEETAAECMYSLPRAGKDITGPSIRFAEIVFASYGNLRAGARFVELDTKDARRAAVVIEGACLDLQMNVAQQVPVRRSIVGKKGMYGADMTNIAFSAGAAIARREAILKTVPKAIWGPAYKRVIAVLQGDATTLAKRRADLMAAFAKRGIKPEQVLATFENVPTIEDLTIEHMPRLFGMLTALADGSETIDSMFGKPGGDAHTPVADPLRDEQPEPGHMAISPVFTVSVAEARAAEAELAAAAARQAAATPPKADPPKASVPTADQYIAASREWLLKQDNPSEIDAWWRRERKTRAELKMTAAQLGEIEQCKEARIAELENSK